MCSLGSNWQQTIIGCDNGLLPNRRKAIISINDGIVYWRIYASPGLNELHLQQLPNSTSMKDIRATTKFVHEVVNVCDLMVIHVYVDFVGEKRHKTDTKVNSSSRFFTMRDSPVYGACRIIAISGLLS